LDGDKDILIRVIGNQVTQWVDKLLEHKEGTFSFGCGSSLDVLSFSSVSASMLYHHAEKISEYALRGLEFIQRICDTQKEAVQLQEFTQEVEAFLKGIISTLPHIKYTFLSLTIEREYL
jgi:hypothetical protein